MIRFFVFTLILAIPCATIAQNKDKQPKAIKFDWAMMPAPGDKDGKERGAAVAEKYVGSRVSVEGLAHVTSTSDRDMRVEIRYPVKRGEVGVFAVSIYANFRDVKQEPIKAACASGKLVTFVGTFNEKKTKSGSRSFFLEPAELVKTTR